MNGNRITVHFTGICTHVTADNQLMSPPVHRVVLVRGDDGAYINDAKIPPHVPMLKIDPADIVALDGYVHGLQQREQAGVWLLGGVKLELYGTTGTVLNIDANFRAKVPRLSKLTPNVPHLFEEVVIGERAACYFDIASGTLTATEVLPSGAVGAMLTADTGEAPGLRVTCFWNRESHVISLRPGATIYVENIGVTSGDSIRDFLLHYRVLQSIPRDAGLPPGHKTSPSRPTEMTSGCSNSAYP